MGSATSTRDAQQRLHASCPQINKLFFQDVKSVTDLLYEHAKFGGNRTSHAGARWESSSFINLLVTLATLLDNGQVIQPQIASALAAWWSILMDEFLFSALFLLQNRFLALVLPNLNRSG